MLDKTPKQPRFVPENLKAQMLALLVFSTAGRISSTGPMGPVSDEGVDGDALEAIRRSQTLTTGSPAGPAEMK